MPQPSYVLLDIPFGSRAFLARLLCGIFTWPLSLSTWDVYAVSLLCSLISVGPHLPRMR
jgi:hypothetical protein